MSIEQVLSGWIESLPVLALIPVSATPETQLLFANNLKLFFKLQMRQPAHGVISVKKLLRLFSIEWSAACEDNTPIRVFR